MTDIHSLNDLHKSQLSRYQQFFKGKRDKNLQDIETGFGDFCSDRLSDASAIFQAADVIGTVQAYKDMQATEVREALEQTVNLSSIFIVQLMGQAQAHGIALHVDDISIVEDQSRLQQISQLHSLPPPVAKSRAALPTLGSSTQADPAALAQIQELQEANRQMQERYQAMQAEVTSLYQERSTWQAQLDQAKQLVDHLKLSAPTADTTHIEQSLANTKAHLDGKSVELEQLRNEMNQRLGDSTQFRDLKAIVKKKTEEIKNLKSIMIQYGIQPPDAEGGIDLVADDD